MVSRYWGLLFALLTCATSVPSPLWADCDAVLRLSALYDGFMAVTREKGDQQKRIAARLYPNIASANFSSLVADLNSGPLHNSLQLALEDARDLTRDVLTTSDMSAFRALDVADNMQVIATFITASDCPAAKPGNERASAPGLGGKQGQTDLGPSSPSQAGANSSNTASASTLGIVVVGTTLAIGGLATAIFRSRPAKIYRMKRLPRRSISLSIPASYETEENSTKNQDVVVMDISLGGMKLRMPDPMPDGAKVILKLPIRPVPGSVVWSTAHYAGIMFDDRLSDADLNKILDAA